MIGSRTVKVLFTLILAMTFGALALRLLETKPSPLSATDLAAQTSMVGVELDTSVPLGNMWRNIVVHTTGAESADVVSRVHFVIDQNGAQLVRPTGLWRMQRPGQSNFSPARDYNTDSIAICLRGDFSTQAPSSRQFQELVKLVRSLQQTFNIPADKVFMYRPDLANGQPSPGAAFPVRTFSSALIRT